MTKSYKHHSPENLLIFKTNINSKQQVKAVQQIFNTHQSISDWWVDTDDIDNVMRVKTNGALSETDIIKRIETLGINCESL